MNNLWIEILSSPDQSDIVTPGSSAYKWQAMFACQVGVMTHQNWATLKWGFNAGALFDEANERQKLFLESRHSLDEEIRVEDPRIKSIAYRYMNTLDGLLVVIIGKVSGKTKEEAELLANDYCQEIISTFPYDYSLLPAATKEEFNRMTGADVLLGTGHIEVIQIKRAEIIASSLAKEFPYFQGLWQSAVRSLEQIWRSINVARGRFIINIQLRPTILYEGELQIYSNLALEFSKYQPGEAEKKIFNSYKDWYDSYINRRLTPWKKFYYLQVHIASTNDIPDSLVRSIGTALTQSSTTLSQPGYQVIRQPTQIREREWADKIYKLCLISWGGRIPNPRLSEVADLEEVFSVMRLPYNPPGENIPGFKYLGLKGS
jgi:hypothetical protein